MRGRLAEDNEEGGARGVQGGESGGEGRSWPAGLDGAAQGGGDSGG